MNKLMRRLLSCALAGAMAAGMCLTASAYGDFKYPNSYWPIQTEYLDAVNAKDVDGIIAAAQKTYDALSPLGLGQDVCENLASRSERASWACEIKGDIAGAITWAERQRTYCKWLNECGLVNTYGNPYNFNATLLGIETRLNFLRAAQNVTVYAQTDNSASPYSVGPRTGTWYGTPANAFRSDTNASLMYVTFGDSYSVEHWVNFYSNNFEGFRRALDGGVIELAWNFNPESTDGSRAVLSSDSYIAENLRTMGGLNATVLLRVGAEMNNWANSDPEVFKQAFRKIAAAARAYPNIQMVFSPSDVSNTNVTIADYYPGDEYVDWVGMSTYHNSQYAGYGGAAAAYDLDYSKYYNDSYYGYGLYDHDPITAIKPVVDVARAHNKPVMISECGFAYRTNDGEDLTAFATEQLTWFYSYLNMVYPEVKAAFYFDASGGDGKYIYGFDGSPTLSGTYEKTIRDNGAYLDDVHGSATGWTTLDKAALTGLNTVRLASFASLPGKHSTTVKYFLDGKEVYSSSQVPFYYDLNLSSLSGGSHTLKVEASGGQFKTSSQDYTFIISGGSAGNQPVNPQPSGAQAMPTNDSLTADGVLQDPTVYKINGSNYFKIRDLAAILDGTEKQFSVGYDGDANAVTVTSGQPYEKNGSELAGAAQGGNKDAMSSNDAIYINGAQASVEVYKIDGSNYFKLRDLGKALDFYVGWTAEQGVFIDTAKPYSE